MASDASSSVEKAVVNDDIVLKVVSSGMHSTGLRAWQKETRTVKSDSINFIIKVVCFKWTMKNVENS